MAPHRLFSYLRRVLACVSVVRHCIGQFSAALLVMWPVTLTLIMLTFCFAIPGLASDQNVEVMLGYLRVGGDAGIVWTRYLVTLCATIALSSILRTWSKRLLAARVPPLLAGGLSMVAGIVPLFIVALAFVQLASTSMYFVCMAIGLVVIYLMQIRYRILSRWLRAPKFFLGLNATLLCWLCLFVVLVAFGFSDRDSTLGLPVSLISISQALGPINLVLLSFCIWATVVSEVDPGAGTRDRRS
jgi:hypothetical protein